MKTDFEKAQDKLIALRGAWSSVSLVTGLSLRTLGNIVSGRHSPTYSSIQKVLAYKKGRK